MPTTFPLVSNWISSLNPVQCDTLLFQISLSKACLSIIGEDTVTMHHDGQVYRDMWHVKVYSHLQGWYQRKKAYCCCTQLRMTSVMHCYLSRLANHCDVSLDGYIQMFSSKPDPIMKRIIRNIKSRIDILIFSSFPVKADKSYWSFLTLVPKNMWSLENMSERECL